MANKLSEAIKALEAAAAESRKRGDSKNLASFHDRGRPHGVIITRRHAAALLGFLVGSAVAEDNDADEVPRG